MSDFLNNVLFGAVCIAGWELAKYIEKMQNTWKCPHCTEGKGFSLTAKNDALRKEVAEIHLKGSHPEVLDGQG